MCVSGADGDRTTLSSTKLSASAAARLPRNQRSRHQNVRTNTGNQPDGFGQVAKER